MKYKKIALITGASSGMGKEMARQLDKIYTDGLDEIWLIARREERLFALSDELRHKTKIFPMDITLEDNIEILASALCEEKANVKILVNASGYGIVGKFKTSLRKEEAGMVRLNCEALLNVTHVVLKHMKRGGRIIQFASAAAFVPQIDFSVYAATKSFVLSFSRSLNEELKKEGISVTAVCPGPVKTEFFTLAEKHGTNFNFKKFFMKEAPKVVRQALIDSYHRRDVSVYSVSMNLFRLGMKFIPHGLTLKIMNLF